jgi:hypothetical protein
MILATEEYIGQQNSNKRTAQKNQQRSEKVRSETVGISG